jgi:hypothetical protein
MGALHDAKVKLESLCAGRKLNPAQVKGSLSLRAGILLALVNEATPDDPVKLEKLRAAARELFKMEI